MDFFELTIPREQQANLILSAETEELGITAGLQDRVAQVYEGLVYMDFSRDHDPQILPTMFVAYQTQPTKVSGRVLNDLSTRWEQGDVAVRETLDRIAELASRGKNALLEGHHERFASLMNENFDLRRHIMRIDRRDLAMVEAARRLGASAKLTGSGGAIIGALEDDTMQQRVAEELGALGARVIEAETTKRNRIR